MPQLKDVRETKEIKSVVPGGVIVFYKQLLAGDIEKVAGADKSSRVLKSLSLLIKEWNFDDDKDQRLPIIPENVAKLDMRDIEVIQEIAGMKQNEEKDFLNSGN